MNDFIGKNYTVPQLDLSVKPEDTAEEYAYLYEQTVVDDSESYLGHPDSVLLKNGDILTVYPHGHGKGAVLNKISADGGRSISSPANSSIWFCVTGKCRKCPVWSCWSGFVNRPITLTPPSSW